MNQLLGMIEIKLDSETILGGDGSQRETVDMDIQSDEKGLPYLSGRTLKGLLRREADWYLKHVQSKEDDYKKSLTRLFGKPDSAKKHHANHGGLRIGKAKFSDDIYETIKAENLSDRDVLQAITMIRSMTKIDRDTGVAAEGSLRQVRTIHRGYTLFAPVFTNQLLDETDKDLLSAAVKLVRHIGMMRSRGKGEVICQLHWNPSFDTHSKLVETRHTTDEKPNDTQYIILNITAQEPLKINDALRTSDSTQALNYIPGHVIRGALVHAYLNDLGLEVDDLDTATIFNDQAIQFWNGYLTIEGKRSIPFPFHLFETKEQSRTGYLKKDKSADELAGEQIWKKVFNGLLKNKTAAKNHSEAKDENERQSNIPSNSFEKIREDAPTRVSRDALSFSGENLIGASVNKVSQLHLSLNGEHLEDDESKLYRYEAIDANQQFQAIVKTKVHNEFTNWLLNQNDMLLWLGGARNSGYGRSYVTISTANKNPEHFSIEQKNNQEELYIIATSDWILYNEHGQLMNALDGEYLEKELGCKVELQANIVNPSLTGGYVSHWQAYQPMIRAVRAGSIFRYKITGTIDQERIKSLIDRGVGMRKNEGFGRLTILTSWDYQYLRQAQENTSNKTILKRIHSKDKVKNKELEQFKKSIIDNDLNDQLQQKVNVWHQYIADDYKRNQSLGQGDRSALTVTQVGSLLEKTTEIERKIKFSENPTSVYNREWDSYWKGYKERRENKSELVFEHIKLRINGPESKSLQSFIKDELPNLKWESNYFKSSQTKINSLEWSVKALHLLLRKMMRDPSKWTNSGQEKEREKVT